MADITEGITSNGLVQKSYDDLLADIQDGLNEIYAKDGETINFNSDTQDGQLTNIIAQIGTDIRNLNRLLYNSFNPDNVTGTVQDSRYALNYVTRHKGTFTILNIDVTCDSTVTLQGLDGNYNNLNGSSYAIADESGMLWYLIDTVTITAGTHSLAFRSQYYGRYSPSINTMTTPTTIVVGVTGVNNPVAPTTYGETEESNIAFNVRRSRSTSRHGQNNIDSLEGAILDLNGVTDVRVWVNNTGSTDITGTPSMTVWVIVEGGANTDISALIYQYSCGLQTRGAIETTQYSVSMQPFLTKFDRPTPVPLYIKFDYQTALSVGSDFLDALKIYIAENLIYTLNEPAETAKITAVAQQAVSANYGNGYPLDVQISTDGITYTNYIASASLQNKFVVSAENITITNTIA